MSVACVTAVKVHCVRDAEGGYNVWRPGDRLAVNFPTRKLARDYAKSIRWRVLAERLLELLKQWRRCVGPTSGEDILCADEERLTRKQCAALGRALRRVDADMFAERWPHWREFAHEDSFMLTA